MAMEFVPDLIICDIPRPCIDGYEVLRCIISTSKISDIPFIFCTTLSKLMNRLDALALGAEDYIIKHFELEAVLGKVKAYMIAGSKRQKIIF